MKVKFTPLERTVSKNMEDIASISSLMDENKDLRFEIEQQLNIIESQKQELHSANRKLETLNKMKVEMEIEIEALTGLQQIGGNLESKVKSLEAELSSTKLKCTNLEMELNDEKTRHEISVLRLTTEIENLKKERNEEAVDEKQKEELHLKLTLLREINDTLTHGNKDLQIENKSLLDKTLVLELTINERNQELEEMRNLLESKQNDLKSALKLVDELQEEKATLNGELTTLKCRPNTANGKRGNSLFAEVEDKRLTMACKLDVMASKYKELKKSFMKKNAEIKALEGEINNLRKQWKEDENAPYTSVAAIIESKDIRIQELQKVLNLLEKRPESPQIITISEFTDRNFECIKDLVEAERKINRELMQEMEQRSIRELAQSEEIFRMNRERRVLKARIMDDAVIISELKKKLKEDVVPETE